MNFYPYILCTLNLSETLYKSTHKIVENCEFLMKICAVNVAVDVRAFIKFCPHFPHFLSDFYTAGYRRCLIEIIEWF
jgi:hypothetical protein